MFVQVAQKKKEKCKIVKIRLGNYDNKGTKCYYLDYI